MEMIIKQKNLKNNKKNEDEIKVRRFYLLCYSLFYCSARNTTSITYATLRKWSTLSFYDVKEYLAIAELKQLIKIDEINGKLKIDLLPLFYKFICIGSYEDRNRLFVAANLKAATGQIARLMLFYMAGRTSYEKRSKLSDSPVRISQIVSFFSKKFIFEIGTKIGRNKQKLFGLVKTTYNYGESDPYSRGLEKKIREAIRQLQEKNIIISEQIPREQLSEEEKKNKHGNIKQHILNIFPFYLKVQNYCQNNTTYKSNLTRGTIVPLFSFDKATYEKKKKEKKEKKENLKKEKLTTIVENLKKEKQKKQKKEENKLRIGKKKQAIGLLLLKQKKIDEFLLFAQRISQDQSKIFEWFWGGLCKLTKNLYKKNETKQKKAQTNHFKKMWRKLKKKSGDFFDMIKQAIKGVYFSVSENTDTTKVLKSIVYAFNPQAQEKVKNNQEKREKAMESLTKNMMMQICELAKIASDDEDSIRQQETKKREIEDQQRLQDRYAVLRRDKWAMFLTGEMEAGRITYEEWDELCWGPIPDYI